MSVTSESCRDENVFGAGDEQKNGPAVVAEKTRPWVRYWARSLDIMVFSAIAGSVIAFLAPELVEAPWGGQLLGILLLCLWTFVEAQMLAFLGTTPGKWLLRVRIRKVDGSSLSGHDALTRSVRVWFRGVGMGLPIVNIITMIISYRRIKAHGITSWDRDGTLSVEHSRIGITRITTAVMIFMGLVAIATASI